MKRVTVHRFRYVSVISVVLAVAVVVLAVPALGSAANGVPSWAVSHDRPGHPKPRLRSPDTEPVPPGDEVVTASADTGGYHLFAASAGGAWRWQPLATLQPAGYDGQRWIGEQCITGDGRFVVAVVAPWSAQNSAAGMAAGGIAYAIDAHTGKTRPLAAGVGVTYFNPGCGANGTAALTRFTPDQTRTQVLVTDLRSGTIRTLPSVPGELTSAVPAAGQVLAARGGQLVAVSPRGVRPVATAAGQVYSVRANAAGGADFLAVQGTHGSTAAFSWSPGRDLLSLGHGSVHELRLYGGPHGDNIMLGAAGGDVGLAAAPVTRLATSDLPAQALSLRGQVMLRGQAALVRSASDAAVAGSTASLPTPARAVTSLPATPGTSPRRGATAARTAGAVGLDDPPPPGPACSVPRLNDRYQVPQPSSAQIEWATQMAGSGRLIGPGGSDLRPTGFDNLAGSGWSPSNDYPLPAPFGSHGGEFVPKQILDGILAQESNWNQASPHAPQGLAGDPYVADYYGYNATGTIDYTKADCGYGLGQITDGMRLGSGHTAPSTLQQRVAVDYAENVAAAARILALKWNQLKKEGITIDGADPSQLEDWYFSVWAYNSGVNPQGSTGNTTNCTPGPSCADSAGNWGLGWTNNPANPVYNPARFPFLHRCNVTGTLCAPDYLDAASPQGWPYQEKVLGWIETPQFEPNGVTTRYPGTYNYILQTGYFLTQPPHIDLCNSSNHCDYTQALLGGQPCAYSASGPLQWHCWWHEPLTGVCVILLAECHQGDTAASTAAEPTVADPFPATCTNTMPADTVIVNDGSVGDTTTGLNLAGCPGERGGPSTGSFAWVPNIDGHLQPTGLVDLHQLGTGYGGRMLFTHLQAPANQQWGGTAQWQLSAGYDVYDVAAFVPALGASGTISYSIYNNQGDLVGGPIPVTQADYSNQWVYLGRFYLGPGAMVSASSVVPGGDATTDVAFDAMAFSPVASYAALGDSYSAGVGTGNYSNPNHIPGDSRCLRSPDSFPGQFGQGHGYPNELTVNLACSGGVIDNITTTSRYGEPAQIDLLPKHAHLVTVTIGGNDAGFSDVLKHCLTPLNRCEFDYTQDNTTPGGSTPVNLDYTISNLEPQLENVFREIKARAPAAKIIALTYPNIFQPTSTRSCLLHTVLTLPAQDIEWLISEANNLDNQIETAAQNAGVSAVDERYAFAGHEVCAADPWVNGAVSGDPDYFHPSISGYTQEAGDLGNAVANPGLLVPRYNTLRDPRPGTPNGVVARRLLALFPPGRATYNGAGYARRLFNPGAANTPLWATWPHAYGACMTRVLVLHRDDGQATPPANRCDLTGAFWYTPYDALTAGGTPLKVTDPSTPVDHVVPLKDAWANGASGWTQDTRVDFANDLRGLQLIPATVSLNSSKSDRSIEQWQPPNAAYGCAYAEMWVAIKYQWNIAIDGRLVEAPATTDEWDWLNNKLRSC